MGLLGQFMAWKYPNIFGNRTQTTTPVLPTPPQESITPDQLGSLINPWSVNTAPTEQMQIEKTLPIAMQDEYYGGNPGKPSFMRQVGNKAAAILPLYRRFTEKKKSREVD